MLDTTDFVTLSDAARAAKVSRRTLQNHMAKGTAPDFTRFGREVVFTLSEVLSWAAKTYPHGTRHRKTKKMGRKL